jgi:hypothetical protein
VIPAIYVVLRDDGRGMDDTIRPETASGT